MKNHDIDAAIDKKYGSFSNFLDTLGFSSPEGIHAYGEETPKVCPGHDLHDNNKHGKNCHCNNGKHVWHCFSCGEGGGAVEAVMFTKGMDNSEAYKWLLDELGLRQDNYEYTDKEVRNIFVSVCHKLLLRSFQEQEEYHRAWSYARSRGFTPKMIKKYRFGYCRGWEAIQEMRRKGFRDNILERAGILRRSKKTGNLYPFFMGRLTMMVGDNVYGRSINPSSDRRHLYTTSKNSVFNMGMLASERDAVQLTESAYNAITCEQYNDALKQNWTCIATCGTKGIPTSELVAVLKKANPAEVVVIPDMDPWRTESGARHAVGQKAGLQKALALQAAGLRVRIMVLPDNSDANDLSKKGVGAAEFENLMNKAGSPLKFSIYCMAHYHALGEHSGNAGFLNEVAKAVRKDGGSYLTSEILDYISLLTKEDKEDIRVFLEPSLKKSSALGYVRSQIAAGRKPEDIRAELGL